MVSQTVAGVKTLGTGEVSEELDSYPFGEERITTKNATFDTPRKFTGKETDEELGLIYFGARYYDSRIGRFISLDPSTLMLNDPRSFVNPQGFNFYSYVMNNPVRYVDPDGRQVAAVVMPAFIDPTYSRTNISEFAGFKPRGQSAEDSPTDLVTAWGNVYSGQKYDEIRNCTNCSPVEKFTYTALGTLATASGVKKSVTNIISDFKKAAEIAKNARIIKTNKGDFELSDHAIERMTERKISKEEVINTINNNEGFQYFYDKKWQTGFYDKNTQIFIGKGDKITTAINKVDPKYIQGLMGKVQ